MALAYPEIYKRCLSLALILKSIVLILKVLILIIFIWSLTVRYC